MAPDRDFWLRPWDFTAQGRPVPKPCRGSFFLPRHLAACLSYFVITPCYFIELDGLMVSLCALLGLITRCYRVRYIARCYCILLLVTPPSRPYLRGTTSPMPRSFS